MYKFLSLVFRFVLLIGLISNLFQILAKLWFGNFEEKVVLGRVRYNRIVKTLPSPSRILA